MRQPTRIAMAVAVALQAMSAIAQEDPRSSEPMQRVEITGSRIRQVDVETAQPVQTLTREQLQKTGQVTLGDIIGNLSAAGTPAFSKGAVLGLAREQGGQYINMRNLGANRLLVLVDGRRWTTTVAGFTDLSTIPVALIERVEVLKDGASAIYGSDAIAGVVNIILRRSIEGGQLSVYGGANEKGDGRNQDYALTWGAGTDTAGIMLGLTHTVAGTVWANDRLITAGAYGPGHLNAGFGASPWGRIAPVDPRTGTPLAGPGGFNRMLNHTGSYDGGGIGANARDRANYHDFTNADADLFNPSTQMMYTMPEHLTSVFARGRLALPWDMRLTTTVMFADRTSTRQAAGFPFNSLTQSRYPVYVDKDSYYNPYGNGAPGIAQGTGRDLFFARRMVELPRIAENTNRTLHVDAGLAGSVNALSRAWDWKLGVIHSEVDGRATQAGNLNLPNLRRALGPSFLNAGGTVQCGSAAAPVPLADCVPFDILGGPSASTAAALDYVRATSRAEFGSTVNSATADITGALLDLPAGPLDMAAGLEYRSVSGYDRPGQFEQSGLSTDAAGNATSGRYHVKEAYVELNVPLLKNAPFARLLSLDLAARHSDYSNFGNTTRSKASAQWRPVRDLLVRAGWAQGFRAPTVGDTFGGGTRGYDAYLDPCDSQYGEAAVNPAVRARCAAFGVPAGFRQKNQVGAPVPASGGQTPYPFTFGLGNADLQPETAVTRTAGLVYSPSFAAGLTVAIDYFDIAVKNRIAPVTAAYEINGCYVNGIGAFCDNIGRDASGQIATLSRSNANLGELNTKGFDVTFAYRFPRSALGQFQLRSDSTYVDTFRVRNGTTAAWDNYAGEYAYNRVKSNWTLDWTGGNWSATLASRYYSGVKVHCWSAPRNEECSNPAGHASWGTGYARLGAMVYSDLAVGYAFPWKGKLLVGANNVFDRRPRIVYDAGTTFANGTSASSSVDPQMPIDRFFYVRYTQSF